MADRLVVDLDKPVKERFKKCIRILNIKNSGGEEQTQKAVIVKLISDFCDNIEKKYGTLE